MRGQIRITGGITYSGESAGKTMREDSRDFLEKLPENPTVKNPYGITMYHPSKLDTPLTQEEEWHFQREWEYQIIRKHMGYSSYVDKQLAVFMKFPDGSKYLGALVDLRATRNPYEPLCIWREVRPNGSLVSKRIDIRTNGKLSLPERVMRKMLGIGDTNVRVYAQLLKEIKRPAHNTTRYERITVHETYRYFKDER